MTALFYPFQVAGAEQLAGESRYYLGDEPGLGKTRTALLAAQRAGARHVMVVCPAIARSHWVREYDALGLATTFTLTVESYQRLVISGFVRSLAKQAEFDTLIVDEAHYLANPSSKRTGVVLGQDGLARNRARVWFLSGTPMPRNPLDLYAVLASMWPAKLTALGIRSKSAFLDYFCVWRPTVYGPRIFGVKNGGDLRAILGEIMLRRMLVDVAIELPELRWSVLPVSPTPEDIRSAGEAATHLPPELRAALEGGELPQSGPTMAQLRRALGIIKAPYAAELIADELQDGGKMVVLAYHHDVLDQLEERLRPEGVARVDGATAQSLRDTRLFAFQENPDVRVFLGQITACSTAITLTAAHRVVIVEPDWAAHVNLQAGKRIHRIGQRNGCSVRMLALADTLDDAIVRSHYREVRMLEEVTR